MAYWLLLITPLFWAGNVVSTRAIYDESSPLVLAFLRWSVAFLLISPWAVPALIRQWREIRDSMKVLISLSLFGVAFFNSFIYLGVQSTTATNTALFQGIIPVLILMLNRMFYAEPVSKLQWVGVFASIFGIIILVSKADLGRLLSLEFNRGDLWIALAVSSWAVYSVGLRHKPREVEPFTFFAFSVLVGVIVLLPVAIWEQGSLSVPELSTRAWGVVGYISIFPSIVAYLFWNRGVAELGASTAGLFINLIPVFGLGLAVIFLKETIHGYHLAGIILIVVGVWLAVFQRIFTKAREAS